MKALVFVVAVLAMAAQQPERYPGQRDHAVPPDGWMCAPQNLQRTIPLDHVCTCLPHCYTDGTGVQRVQEDPKCQVWCHPSHCSCKPMNDDEGADCTAPRVPAENPNL